MKLPKELQRNVKRKDTDLISKVNEKNIKEEFPVNQIIDESSNMPIPCPKCSKTDLLRGWEVEGASFALCYFCGSVFSMDTEEILYTCNGDRIGWGASALAIIGSKEHHKSQNEI